ncbi:hypothetical protein ACFX10_016349 [Malus domestica]
MKKIAKELDAIAGEWVEENKQRRAKGDAKGEQDIIDVLLSVLDGADLGGFDADTINKATSLIIATPQKLSNLFPGLDLIASDSNFSAAPSEFGVYLENIAESNCTGRFTQMLQPEPSDLDKVVVAAV